LTTLVAPLLVVEVVTAGANVYRYSPIAPADIKIARMGITMSSFIVPKTL
jgi:hypothetical protein